LFENRAITRFRPSAYRQQGMRTAVYECYLSPICNRENCGDSSRQVSTR